MCSTPWTMPKFIRWQLRDWVSCFLACRFPMDDDDESEKFKNMVLEIKDDMRGNNRTLSSSRRRNRFRNGKQGINHDLTQERNRNSSSTNSGSNNNNNVLVSLENMISNDSSTSSSWPHFQEEDYIVFCFKEDGAFDVVKDSKSELLERFDSTNNRIQRPVNRKLNYGEVAETVRKSSHGKRSNAHGNDAFLRNGERINTVEEGEEEQNSNMDIKSSIASFSRYQYGEIENHGTVSVESSDSNQSESSTGSFSFPVLHWEPMGSPAQMPKSEGLCTRKHKLPCARFQCFRF